MISQAFVEHAREAMSSTLLVLAFRSLPFLFYLASRVRRDSVAVVVAVLAYALLVALVPLSSRDILAWCCVGFLYYASAVCLVQWLSKATSGVKGWDALLLFVLLVLAFLGVPATLLHPVAFGTFQILGWELVLKGYSYVIEGGARSNTLRRSLFFFLVDPTIVLVQRARELESPRFVPNALLRVAIGVTSVFAAFLLFLPLTVDAERAVTRLGANALVPGLVVSGFVQLLAAYSQHAGLAHIQLGLLRMCGYVAAERYQAPLLARSPLDFWNRWNTYVGQWGKRYLYLPLALRLARRARRRNQGASGWAPAVALIAAFTAMGALHDLYTWAADRNLTAEMTAFFSVNGVLLVAWEAGARFIAASTPAHRPAPRLVFAVAFSLFVGAWALT
jgi:hypothetical protein